MIPGSRRTVTVLSLNSAFIELATQTELTAYLRSLRAHIPANFDIESLRTTATAVLNGALPTKFVGTLFEQRRIARENVDAGLIPKTVVPWAYEWPEPSQWLPFDEDFFYHPIIDLNALQVLINLFASISLRTEKSPPNPHGIFGSYVMNTASTLRYKGGTFNILKKGLASCVSGWAKPITTFFVGVVQGSVVIKGKVHASMKEELYDTKLWLAREHAITSRCNCVGRQIFDHHGMSILLQTETALLLPTNSMLEILIDAFQSRFATLSTVQENAESLKTILETIHGKALDPLELLPQTERSPSLQ